MKILLLIIRYHISYIIYHFGITNVIKIDIVYILNIIYITDIT